MADALAPVELTAPGLLLRPWRASDAPAVTAVCQDVDVQRWTTVPRPYLPEHGEAFVADDAARWAAGLASFAVVDAEDGRLLGSHGIVRRPGPGVVEVGLWVAREARGRGVATAATTAVVRWAFDALGVQRVEWRAEVGNLASRAVAERVGFTGEGVARGQLTVDGEPRDAWVAGLLPTDPVPAARSRARPVLEHAPLSVRPGRGAAFEAAFDEAKHLIAAARGFRGLTLSRCVERPDAHLLLVDWDSVEDHEVGFRSSPAYRRWRELLHPFYDPHPVVEHHERLVVVGG